MYNVLFYKDNKIAYVNGLSKANGLFEPLTDLACSTEHGFLIPLSPNAFTLLDHMNNESPVNAKYQECYTAALVDEMGVLREFYFDNDAGGLLANRKPAGPGFMGVVSRWLEVEESAWSALNLTDTIEEAVELYCVKQSIDPSIVRIITIDEIVKILVANRPTKV